MRATLFALLLFVVQAASPVPRRAPDSSTEAGWTSQQTTASQKQQPEGMPHMPSGDSRAQAPSDETTGERQRGEDTQHSVIVSKLPPVTIASPKRDWADWGTWGFNFLLVVVGLLQALLLCWTFRLIRHQAREMTKQRMVMRGQLEAMRAQLAQMESSGRQTDRLIEQATASADAAKTSANAFVDSERAWVVAELVPMCAKYGNVWHELKPYGPVSMSVEDVFAGKHLRYKLRFTNMGRTPAQILGFTIVFTCLGEGVRDLPESGIGERHRSSYRSFEHLLAEKAAVEIEEPITNVWLDIENDFDAIREFKKTAVYHGWVRYRHMFSTANDCFADFCYSYTASQERLTTVSRYTKQRQEKAD